MRLNFRQQSPGPQGENKLKKYLRPAAQVLVLVFILLIVFLTIHNLHKPVSVVSRPAKTKDVEQTLATPINKRLADGNYDAYVRAKSDLANQYTGARAYADAQRVMDDVFKNVPANKINSGAYYAMMNLEQAKGDKVQYKHYLQLLIGRLKQEGNSEDANAWQQVLNKS